MFLIFDTETTGLPKNFQAPYTDSENWPRIVQLAWQLHDLSGHCIEQGNVIVYPDGYNIPYNAFKVHGISTELAQKLGIPMHDALIQFLEVLKKSKWLCGHNIGFDISVVWAELHRLNLATLDPASFGVIDTKEYGTPYCKLPGGKGGSYKWPNLSELYKKLFGHEFEEAHDAAVDVAATARALLEMMRLEVIPAKIAGFSPEDFINFRRNFPDTVPAFVPAMAIRKLEETAKQTPEETQVEIKSSTMDEDLLAAPVIHLHCHSRFSVLQSTVHIENLVKQAKAWNMPAVALTDLGNMYGTFEFVKKAQEVGIKAIVGMEFYLTDDLHEKQGKGFYPQMILLAKNKEGYYNLSKLSSIAHTEGQYYVPRLDAKTIQKFSEHLILLTGGIKGEIADAFLNQGERQAEEALLRWQLIFKDHLYIQMNRHGVSGEAVVNDFLVKMHEKHQIPIVAANEVFYLSEADHDTHDILLCVKEQTTLDVPIGKGRLSRYGLTARNYYLKSPDEMRQLFADLPQAILEQGRLVDKIESYTLQRNTLLPTFELPEGFKTQDEYLRYLTFEGAKHRYPELTPEIEDRLNFELKAIENSGYPGYFLIVQDFTRKARSLNVWVGPGRGSAAGSAVAYCLGITDVDPIRYKLLFERFINPERVSLPDIDIDFEDHGRELILNYVLEKYGKEQVAQIVTYGTMASRSSVRDAGRVMGLPIPDVDRVAKLIPANLAEDLDLHKLLEDPLDELKEKLKNADQLNAVHELRKIAKEDSPVGKMLIQAAKLEGACRSVGVHACGVIISPEKIIDVIPISKSKESDIILTQFDNSVVEEAGLLKMDFLGLKNLSILKDCVRIIEQTKGISVDIHKIPMDDPATFELFQKGETNGTFQFESIGMQKSLKELKPDKFEDLIAMNALYRPGPMEYIPEFIARKNGKVPASFDLPEMSEILEETYGITVYQEQVMLLSQKLAGFSKGQADVLRKAMGKKKRDVLDKMKSSFLEGCQKNNLNLDICQKIWGDWEAFASYAFNKSHATCYSWVAYQTAYLKANYPAEYMASLLTHKRDDQKSLSFYLEECRRMKIEVTSPDVNESELTFTVNAKGQIRFALAGIKGVGTSAVEELIEERKRNGPFTSLFNLTSRVNLRAVNKKCLESMAYSGAFDGFSTLNRGDYFVPQPGDTISLIDKAIRFGQQYQSSKQADTPNLFGEISSFDIEEPKVVSVEPKNTIHELKMEKDHLGVYLSGHPLDPYKIDLISFTSHTMDRLDDSPQDVDIQFGGIITHVEHRVDKSQRSFAKFIMEDYSGNREFNLFGEDYLKFKHFLVVGMMVFAVARKKERFRGGPVELKITQMQLLDSIRQSRIRSLTIRLEHRLVDQPMINWFVEIVNQYKGKHNLEILLTDEMEDKQYVRLVSKAFRIDAANQELIDQLLHDERFQIRLN